MIASLRPWAKSIDGVGSPAAAAATGNWSVNQKSEPWPTVLSTPSRPPWARWRARPTRDARRVTRNASIVRGVLNLTPDFSDLTSDIVLLDASGRRVVALKPGPNDVSHLSAGVYFVQSTTANRQPTLSKVVIQR